MKSKSMTKKKFTAALCVAYSYYTGTNVAPKRLCEWGQKAIDKGWRTVK